MKWTNLLPKSFSILFVAALLAACATMGGDDKVRLRLSGAEEVPPVSTSASGTGTVRVAGDRAVSGSFKVRGANFVAAHIHQAAAGQNGPVIIPLKKVSDTEWIVPPGAKLTDAQYDAFRKGNLYVNFHTAQHKGGEIRAQIRPSGGDGGGAARGGY